jgi:glyoxylase-like metal-dependent hydrolase (beta-lactamase superfamily II)
VEIRNTCLYLIVLLGFIFQAMAKEDENKNKVIYQTTKIAEHAYVITRNWDLEGKFRNNIGVVVGDKGLTLINPMYAQELDQLMAFIQTISPKPIQYVINSNWDFHNTGANEALQAKGATLIAHKNTQFFGNSSTQLTFDKTLNLDIGTDNILAYRSYGHSMGHINILFEKANVMFMSDSYRDQWITTPGPYGYKGHIEGLRSALALTDEQTKFMPGTTRSSVFVQRAKLLKEIVIRKAFVVRVIALKDKGMSNLDISLDEEIHVLIATNYERYPEYKKDLEATVQAALYGVNLEESKLSVEALQQYVGIYKLPNDNIVEVLVEDNVLVARAKGSFNYLLVPSYKDEFGWYPPARRVVFTRNEDSSINGLYFKMSEDDLRYGQELALGYLKDIKLIERVN